MFFDYTTLVTSEHKKPRFLEWITAVTQPFNDLMDTLEAIQSSFDVDAAVGAQLDAVGAWVGLKRDLEVPIAGVFFTWDDPDLGWSYAVWKGPYTPSQGVVTLDDSSYRAAIKGRIAVNYFLGTVQSANEVLDGAFDIFGVGVYMVDNQDMSVDVYVVGPVSAIVKALIEQALIIPKTAGVRINQVHYQAFPQFALDAETTYLSAGLDEGGFLT